MPSQNPQPRGTEITQTGLPTMIGTKKTISRKYKSVDQQISNILKKIDIGMCANFSG